MKILKFTLFTALMLIATNGFADWIHTSNGYIPRDAWVVGYAEDGTPLYLCRAHYHGIHPGKTWVGFRGCDISYDGKEITMDNYSIYVGSPPRVSSPEPVPHHFIERHIRYEEE